MSDVTIESIEIEISADAERADKALESLIDSLEKLKAACQGGLDGADKVAKGLEQIAQAAQGFEGINGDKLKQTAEALQSLQSLSSLPDLSGVAQSIQRLTAAVGGIGNADMTTFATNITEFARAVEPLSQMQGLDGIAQTLNSLSKIPRIAEGLQRVDMSQFAQNLQAAAAAIEPFTRQCERLGAAFNQMPAPVQQAVTALTSFSTSASQAQTGADRLGKSLKLINFMAIYTIVRRINDYLKGFVNASTEYVEALNLFTVTMGDAADEAMNFAEKVNAIMGIDISEWIKNQGVFKQLVSGFGMVEEKANLVSQNLTQLGYDISSYFNLSVEDAMLKLQSGIAGELEPLNLAA